MQGRGVDALQCKSCSNTPLFWVRVWTQAQLTTTACLPPAECWRESEFVSRPQMAYYQVARVVFTGRLVAVESLLEQRGKRTCFKQSGDVISKACQLTALDA